MSNRAGDFQQAFRNLQLQPLITEEARRNFWVPYGKELLPELEQMVVDCNDGCNQLFFAGHRGCGKSTLLSEFSRLIENQFFTVFFSISDLIEMSEIDHINILFAIALQLMEKAEAEKLDISPDKRQAILNWFKEHTRTEINSGSAELSAGFNLFSLFKGILKTDAIVRDEIKTKFQKTFRELIDTINLIASEIQLACDRKILVIVDDIDKLDLPKVEEIFQRNTKAFLQAKFVAIYTLPIATIRDGVLKKHIESETGNSIFVMPVRKLFKQGEKKKPDSQPIAETMAILREVLHKRVNPELMAERIGDRMIIYSGGVLRELIRIAQECCRLVRVQILQKQRHQESVETIQIDGTIFQQALDKLRNDMAITLSKDDREILQTVYQKNKPDDPKAEAFLDLLHNIYVIEYRNTESWYELHPLIVEQLRFEGVIT